jgi:hypothetical protein
MNLRTRSRAGGRPVLWARRAAREDCTSLVKASTRTLEIVSSQKYSS